MGRLLRVLKTISNGVTSSGASPKESPTACAMPDNKIQRSPAEAGAAEGPTAETLMSSGEFEDAREFQRPEELDQTLLEIAKQACDTLKAKALCRLPEWTVWTEKKGLLVETHKTSQSGTICGRGSYLWKDPPPEMDIDFVVKVMWDEETKKKYDENTDQMVVSLEARPTDALPPQCFFTVNDDTNLTCQAFKGRFGFSGRYFHVVIQRRKEIEDGVERLILGARSVDPELLGLAHEHIDRSFARERLSEIEKNFVQGFAYVAGIVIERHTAGGNPSFKITYVNDADIVTTGVPRWIIDRVKLDQLGVVKNIPGVLLDAWKNRELDS